MIDNNVKKYLKSQINERMGEINTGADVLLAMFKGSGEEEKVHPLDLQMALSHYRKLAEIKTLLEAYNSNFYDESTKNAQKRIKSALEATEEALSETISALVKILNEEDE